MLLYGSLEISVKVVVKIMIVTDRSVTMNAALKR